MRADDLNPNAPAFELEEITAPPLNGADADAPAPNGADMREPLEVLVSDLTKTAAEIVERLTKSPRLYHRDGPVTVARDPLHGTWAAHPLTAHGVVRETHRTARPFKHKKGEDGSFSQSFVTLPERVAHMALDDKDAWRNLPPLDGFATTPLLHEDGTIRTATGYDPTTRMFCAAVPSVTIPEKPTKEQAAKALRKLREFIRTFAFADATKIETDGVVVVDLNNSARQDESAALHAILTAVCRPCLHLAPALVVTAPNLSGAGAGKGLFVRVVSAIAFGTKPTAITAGHDADELDKRIASALVKAEQVLFLDNLNGRALKSDTLASAITERPAHLRIMGTSKLATVAAASFIAVTGNGLTVSEDMARRVLRLNLDPGVEDPEARKFKTNILAEAFDKRADLLAAALTIWRWGRQSKEITPGRPIGSFDQWARWVRDPLVTLGCADPALRIAETKLHDPRRAAAAELFTKWNERHGVEPVAASDLHPDVKDIADPAGRGRQYLASRIRSFAGTRAAGFVLVRSPANGKWEPDKYVLKTTGAATTGGIGVIGGVGSAAAPMPPMPPMTPEAVSAENGADVQEGEL